MANSKQVEDTLREQDAEILEEAVQILRGLGERQAAGSVRIIAARLRKGLQLSIRWRRSSLIFSACAMMYMFAGKSVGRMVTFMRPRIAG